jgi:uncharacterized protein YfcZ (UPF0381/DUF406 family)
MVMRNDPLTQEIASAIEKADQLNEEAGGILQNAIQKTMGDMELEDDFRFKCAQQMLNAYIQRHNIIARYRLALLKKTRAARAGK